MKALVSLAAIGALCAVLLAGTHAYTVDAIQVNREAQAWRVAFELTGGPFPTGNLQWHGNRLELPNGFVLRRATVDGYAGAIEMLAAFRPPDATGPPAHICHQLPAADADVLATKVGDGCGLAGVRVTRHRETPGLGDFIDTAKSPWILQFADRSPEQVDAVTGATITSEAVKRGILNLLQTSAAESSENNENSRDEPEQEPEHDNSILSRELPLMQSSLRTPTRGVVGSEHQSHRQGLQRDCLREAIPSPSLAEHSFSRGAPAEGSNSRSEQQKGAPRGATR